MKKRILALVLALVLTVSLMPAAFAEAGFDNFKKVQTYTPGQFTDVKSTDWFAENVQVAYEYGLMYGDSATTFNPNGNLTVAEAVALVCRMHKIYNDDPTPIPDSDPWYQSSIDYAVEKGFFDAEGYESYNVIISRADFVMLIAASLPEEAFPAVREFEEGRIPDVPADAEYHDAVYMLYNAGILSGYDETAKFLPESSIRRSEVSTVVLLTCLPEERATRMPGEFRVGDIVEIKAGEKKLYPNGPALEDWYFNFYFTISAVDQNGKPVVKGGVDCVQLGIQILKKDGVDGKSSGNVFDWVDPAILTLVRAVEDKPVDPVDPDDPDDPDVPARAIQYGDIVEIKADAKTLFPNGTLVDSWMRVFYFKVTALTDEMNYPVTRGNIQCVKLGVLILKRDGVDSEPIGTADSIWVDPAILTVVKESTEPDPGPKPLDPSILKAGDIVEIKADATVWYPEGGSIPAWTKDYYFSVGQVVATKYGGKDCVMLKEQIKKADGPDGKSNGQINTIIAQENVTLVKRQPWNDPTQYTVYVVKATDTSFWQIAQDQLGNGALYTEIYRYNGFTDKTSLKTGMMIKLPLKK